MSTPNPPSGGPPLRALAMVLIALAIVFAGLGAMSLSKSESEGSQTATVAPATSSAVAASHPAASAAASSAAPVVTSTTTTESSPAAEAAPTGTPAPATTTAPPAGATSAAPVDKSVPVRVLNNSTIAGLAAKTGSQLTSGGWNVTETGNYPDGVVSRTTVYYGSSPQEKAAAQAIANDLGVTAEPRFAGIADSPPGVIVIVTGN
ncbi:LytR C-terminal domain-containing protein [Nocardia sp. alder85J]|uniref:LytR C-terminal domain-containing protein n=1 Tax=Nocardia sp. alder85J TaxID=2862949 RepID=UPI001CD77621|nr:LytR C-terminal domain-containing protein [Nocardia sp. alder85J]MCX4098984.1 LytR C-terminal domain-containing protein [Nocardia sp. alder85J]